MVSYEDTKICILPLWPNKRINELVLIKGCKTCRGVTMTNRGSMRFTLYRENMTSQVLTRFLQRLIKDAERIVFLVLDNMRVHNTKVVQAWLEKHQSHIEAFFLTSYSSELTPHAFINGNLKIKMSASEPTRFAAHLKKVVSHLRSIQGQPNRM